MQEFRGQQKRKKHFWRVSSLDKSRAEEAERQQREEDLACSRGDDEAGLAGVNGYKQICCRSVKRQVWRSYSCLRLAIVVPFHENKVEAKEEASISRVYLFFQPSCVKLGEVLVEIVETRSFRWEACA